VDVRDSLWREVDIFVPARLTDENAREYVHRQVAQIASDAGEFVVDVRADPVGTCDGSWQKWVAAYLSSSDPGAVPNRLP
jgi:hypothetical protein